MLIVRKNLKVGLGVVAAAVAAGAAYAIVLAVSGDKADPNKTVATAEPPANVISTADEPVAVEPGHGIDPALPDNSIPPARTPDAFASAGDANDPNNEKNRNDGNATPADWSAALNRGEVSTTRLPEAPTSNGVALDVPVDRATRPVPAGDNTPAPQDKQASVGAGTYTVAAGDTFSSISQKVYGSRVLYSHLLKANPAVDPSRMKIGTVITVPTLDAIKAVTPNFASPIVTVAKPVDARSEYRVVAGDSLNRIATKLYGKSAKWQAIYDLNKSAIGNDPAKLKLDMILKLPEAPVTTASSR